MEKFLAVKKIKILIIEGGKNFPRSFEVVVSRRCNRFALIIAQTAFAPGPTRL